MTSGMRVFLHYFAEDVRDIELAYHRTSEELASVQGMLGNELLRSVFEPNSFIVVGSWRSVEEFQRWERGAEHQGQTAQMRRFRATGPSRQFDAYEVWASY